MKHVFACSTVVAILLASTAANAANDPKREIEQRYIKMAKALFSRHNALAVAYVSPDTRRREGDRNTIVRLRHTARHLRPGGKGTVEIEVEAVLLSVDKDSATVFARLTVTPGGKDRPRVRDLVGAWVLVDGQWYDRRGMFAYPPPLALDL